MGSIEIETDRATSLKFAQQDITCREQQGLKLARTS